VRTGPVVVVVCLGLAGCGGGGTKTSYEDVKPCLGKLALVAANEFTGVIKTPTGGVTTINASPGPETVDWSVDLAYANSARGANAAHLAFFRSADAAKDEVTRAHSTARSASAAATLNPNFRRMLGKAEVLGDSVVLTWSSDPAPQQKRRLRACFN
jgi:hypothetical protein